METPCGLTQSRHNSNKLTITRHSGFWMEEDETMPAGCKRIPHHCIYDVKFDRRRKCRLVAGGHRTDPPKEEICSGVVSMEAVRLGFILARMNGLQVCAGDVGKAFLCGKRREKVFVTAGEAFGKDAGKRMIIDPSLHGLKSSSARFVSAFAANGTQTFQS
jgi:hypothetical protein